MDLTEDQKALVKKWAAEGDDLADIQEKLRTECGLTLSYIETRFLMADLAVELQDKESEPSEDETPAGASQSLPGDDDPLDADEVLPPAGGGNVRVTLDEIAPAHALVSGKATFSDGETAEWFLDQTGRLALNPTTPGYRPQPQDVEAFQMELQRVVSQRGGF